jgi:peptide/nickel transport system substrate-binding protein
MRFDDRFAVALTRRRALGVAAGSTLALAGISAFGLRSEHASAQSGELVIGWPGITYRTEPDRASIGMYPLNTNIFESLVRLTPDYQVEPMLAESWEFVEPNTWRFVLRQGVTFHDGSAFTAEAVKWSMDRMARAGGGSAAVTEESTVIIDDNTVEITPAQTNLRFVEQLVHPSRGSIIAAGSEPAEKRVGTGPFWEVEYIAEDRYVVEANPEYWGDAPLVSRMTFRFLPDATTRVLALQAGDVDMIAEVPRESVADITGSDLQVFTSGVGAYSAFYFNIHGAAPYDLGQDPVIREAIARAIDKDAIVQGVWQGNAEPGVSIIPPAILGDQVNVIGGTGFDPDAARALLDAAGWIEGDGGIREREGRRLSLEMIVGYPNAATHGQMPEFLQAQLSEIGVEINLVQMPDTATYEERLQAGQGDIWVESGSQNDANPCFLPSLLFSSPDPTGDPEANMYGNAFAPGAEFDELMLQCSSSTTREGVQEAAANGMRLLVDEAFVTVPIAGVYRIFGARSGIEGFVAHPSGVNQRWTSIAVVD